AGGNRVGRVGTETLGGGGSLGASAGSAASPRDLAGARSSGVTRESARQPTTTSNARLCAPTFAHIGRSTDMLDGRLPARAPRRRRPRIVAAGGRSSPDATHETR